MPRPGKVAAIGSATAAALQAAGWPVDVVPERFISEEIADLLGIVTNKRILLVQGDRARPQLADILWMRGAAVEPVAVYRIEDTPRDILIDGLRQLKEKGLPDVATFTSPSAVSGLAEAAREAGLEGWIKTIPIVCIGPVTAEAVHEQGLACAAVAKEFTIPGLVEALSRVAVHVG